MTTFARDDRSVLGRWWWTVDRWTLAALALLVAVGILLTFAASPAVAERIGYEPLHFLRQQLMFLPLALAMMLGGSLLSLTGVRRLALGVLALSLVLLLLTPFAGIEVKGATRWLSLGLFTIQPSEFVKPAFVVASASLLAQRRLRASFRGDLVSFALLLLIVGLIALQPDFGATLALSAVWLFQLFLSGAGLVWIMFLIAGAVGLAIGGYLLLPHVASRVDRFLDPSSGDSYQIDRSLDAFLSGGLFGRGPGQGTVKEVLPDAHTDFIFAVAGEEFGLLLCILIVGLFAFIVLREHNLFVLLAVGGLLAQFGLQAIINMSVTLDLMPAKGMTLPFISYGGSSLIAVAFGMGMVLALTRRRPGSEAWL